MKRSLAACAVVVASTTSVNAFTSKEPSQATSKRGRGPSSNRSQRHRSHRPGHIPSASVARTATANGPTVRKNIDIHESGGESFALRMSLQRQLDDLENAASDNDSRPIEEKQQERRVFLNAMLSGTAAAFASTSLGPEPAAAYDQAYPVDLDFQGSDLSAIRGERIAAQKAAAKKSREDLTSNPLAMREPKDFLGSAVWAVALWFLAGSRSNPLVTPVANVLYDEEEETWLKDRNENLFAPLPPGFLVLMGLIFLALGVVADRSILLLADGDKDICLQLAGVSLIGGASLELGRIASGEKDVTREEDERAMMLQQEFAEFAERRLVPGGNVHRSEIASAFRRFNAKYRIENEQYPLSDLEIERLARAWNRLQGNDDMSSAGFFTGIKINDQAKADAFR
eukprot:CAMPEP_0178610744 /NCGR_PEP_ID=MMETSP0698-20121128/253_1 /TAXON_ID=265572 /ORGANISM="Extubocellulus spinifer, Strain CCMP396" /LENGTH=398 /DNA_ID=CAMNT_0020249351 /DNA_START=20 /DNA_END=1216 /DNA_ORIENTATION=+